MKIANNQTENYVSKIDALRTKNDFCIFLDVNHRRKLTD